MLSDIIRAMSSSLMERTASAMKRSCSISAPAARVDSSTARCVDDPAAANNAAARAIENYIASMKLGADGLACGPLRDRHHRSGRATGPGEMQP